MGPCPDPSRLTTDLGVTHEIMRARFKRYPVGSPIQSPLEAMLGLMRDHQLGTEDIAKVEIRISPPRYEVCHGRNMSSVNVEYLIETALLDGDLTFGNAHDEERFDAWRAGRPDSRVVIVADPAFGDGHGASATIVTHAGDTHHRMIPHIPGSVENPLTPAQVEEKAAGLLVPALGDRRTAGLLDALRRLPDLADVRELQQWLYVG